MSKIITLLLKTKLKHKKYKYIRPIIACAKISSIIGAIVRIVEDEHHQSPVA